MYQNNIYGDIGGICCGISSSVMQQSFQKWFVLNHGNLGFSFFLFEQTSQRFERRLI